MTGFLAIAGGVIVALFVTWRVTLPFVTNAVTSFEKQRQEHEREMAVLAHRQYMETCALDKPENPLALETRRAEAEARKAEAGIRAEELRDRQDRRYHR